MFVPIHAAIFFAAATPSLFPTIESACFLTLLWILTLPDSVRDLLDVFLRLSTVLVSVECNNWPLTSLVYSLLLDLTGFLTIFKRVLCPLFFSKPVTPSKSLSQWLHVISCSGTFNLYPRPCAPADLTHLLAFPPSKTSVACPHSGHLFLKIVL